MHFSSAVLHTNFSVDFCPDTFDVVLSSSKSSQHPVNWNVGCAVVCVKDKVVDGVVHVTGAREDEASVAAPCADSRVQNHCHRNDRVAPDRQRQDAARLPREYDFQIRHDLTRRLRLLPAKVY